MQFFGKKIALLSVLFFGTFVAQAQLRYGIRAGLNFATLRGPYEQNSAGEDLERFENVTGFHIGIGFAYPFTDEFGLRTEFMYSKKGLRYTYEGETYRNFNYPGGSTLTLGEGRRLININHSYIDIPITAYYRLKDFELSAGVYAALQVQAVGEGSAAYSGKTQPLQNLRVICVSTSNTIIAATNRARARAKRPFPPKWTPARSPCLRPSALTSITPKTGDASTIVWTMASPPGHRTS